MFKKIKSINDGVRLVRLLGIGSMIASLLISGWAIYTGAKRVDEANARIYVLSNGKAMRAMAAAAQENLPVEARDHLRNFHHYFFDLGPDEKAIKASIDKSFYLS